MKSGITLSELETQLLRAIKQSKTSDALESITQLGDKSNFWFKRKTGAIPQDQLLTPLHFAAQQGLTDVVKALLLNGSSLKETTQGIYGEFTPLHLAINKINYGRPTAQLRENLVNTIKLMVKTDPSIRCISDGFGYTAVHDAAGKASCFDVLEFLLNFKATPESELLDPNFSSYNNCMPLHTAAEANNYLAVVCLMERGANPEYRNKENKSPYELARNPEIKAYIRKKSFPTLEELCARALYAKCTLETKKQRAAVNDEPQSSQPNAQELTVPEPIFDNLLVQFKKFGLEDHRQERIMRSLPYVEQQAAELAERIKQRFKV